MSLDFKEFFVQLRIALKNSLQNFSLEASFFTPMIIGSQEYLQERFKSPSEFGSMGINWIIRNLKFLGTHFKTPLGIENFLTLQNLTEWPFFIQ